MPGVLRALAVLADPIGPESPPWLTADNTWDELVEAVAECGAPVELTRHRPATLEEIAVRVHTQRPHVLYLDMPATVDGWNLEGEWGEEESIGSDDLALVCRAGTLVVVREAALQALSRLTAEERMTSALELGSPGRDGIAPAAVAMGSLLSQLSGGASVRSAVETGNEIGPLAGRLRAYGEIDSPLSSGSTAGPGEAVRPRLSDPVPPGTPDAPRGLIIGDPRLVDLARSVTSTDSRGALLLGEPGAGKSTAARCLSRRVCHRFPGGILYFSKPSTLRAVVERAARVLSIPQRLDRVLHELGQRHALLVLDDFEAWEPGERLGVADFMAQLSPWSASKVLCVSRKPPKELSSLGLLRVDLKSGLSLEALERAIREIRRADEDAQLEEPAIQLAHHFGGNPRALSFPSAGASAESRLGNLGASLTELVSRSAESRLRLRIKWEFRRLEHESQLLLSRMSLFRAPATHIAIQRVCGDGISELEERLEELVARGMVEARGGNLGVPALAREIAAEALTEETREGLEANFVDCYVEFARFYGSDLGAVEEQLPNLRAALEMGARSLATDDPKLVPLARLLFLHLRENKRFPEAAAALEQIVERSPEEPRFNFQSSLALGDLYWQSGETAKAADKYEECVNLSRAMQDRELELIALQKTGIARVKNGEEEVARDALAASLELAEDRGSRAISLLYLGVLDLGAGMLAESERQIGESLEIFGEQQNRHGLAVAHQNLGNVVLLKGDRERAEASYLQAIDQWQALGEAGNQKATLQLLGNIFEGSDETKARDYRIRAEQVRVEIGARASRRPL